MKKNNKKVLFIDTVHPVFMEELQRSDFECVDGSKLTRQEILDDLHLYGGVVIRSRIKIDEEFIDSGSSLQFIARAGSGMENIDANYAKGKGIACLSAPEGNRDAVAEHAMGMLLSLLHNLNKGDKEVRQGVWKREENRGTELMYKTVGIIGYGNTGSEMALRLSGFRMLCLAYDKYKKGFSNDYATECDMEGLYQEADIISLHLPLTKETEYLVDKNFLAQFHKPIYIINTSRGKIVKTEDLVEGLKSGKVLGACLDVLEYEKSSLEDIERDNTPEPFKYLVKSDKVILSPHVAGWTHESNERISHVLIEKIMDLY